MTDNDPYCSQGCPAGCSRQDHRGFLKLAAAIPALGADSPVDNPKPDATLMPTISLGKYSISRLIVGCRQG